LEAADAGVLRPPAALALAPDAGPPSRNEAILSGYVHDAFRRPVPRARVRVSRKTGQSFSDLAVQTVGDDGRFRVLAGESADVVVEVRAAGFRTRVIEGVKVAAGETRELEVLLEAGMRLSGRVVDDLGDLVAGASVTAVPPAEDDSGDQVKETDPEGRFAFEELGEGPYCVYARKAPLADAEQCGVRPGTEVSLRLSRPGAIAGRVVRSLGLTPVTSYNVSARQTGGKESVAGTQGATVNSPSGEFRLDGLLAGTYVVSVAAEGRFFAQREGVEVRPGETTSGLVFELSAGGRISGRVVSAEGGAPIVGALVELVLGGRYSGRHPTKAGTDDSGHFEFDGVSEGSHRVNVERPGFFPILLQRISPEHLRGEALVLRMKPRRK
jgi:hypothetical protein